MLEGADDHVIVKRHMLLRPGTRRRVSFRATPGGRLEVNAFTKRGPGLGDTEDPIDDGPLVNAPGFEGVGAVLAPILGSGPSGSGSPQPTRHRLSDAGGGSLASASATLELAVGSTLSTPPDSEPEVAEARPLPPGIRTRISVLDPGGGIIIVDEPPRPPDVPPTPMPPVEVTVATRDDTQLAQGVLTDAEGSSTRLTVGRSFPEHGIVDVTFSNPNDFAIHVGSFIRVRNDLDITTTRVSRALIGRLFADTLVWLAPTISVRNGTLRLDFEEEARHTLGLDPLVVDLGFEVDAELTIEPGRFRFLTHEQAIRETAESLREAVSRVRIPNTELPPIPANFVDQVVEAFFSPVQTLENLLDNVMGLRALQWEAALARRPLLTVPPQQAGSRNDVAMRVDYRLSRIRAGASVLEIGVDTIDVSLMIVLRSGNRPEPHPAEEMREDFVRAGYILPRFDFSIDIRNIDVELDIDLPGGLVTSPFEFLAEQIGEGVLEVLADWFEDDFEDEIRSKGLSHLTDLSPLIGELATGIVREIANRDHVFRSLSMDARSWIIETLDPAQLALPFVPPDEVDHRFDDLAIEAPPQDPIDGPMPAGASNQLDRIDHLVFIMMENRSFDHMLGYLSHPSFAARTDVAGLDGRARRLGGRFAGSEATPQPGPRDSFYPDPGHSAATTARQINDGAMNGFVSEFAEKLERDERINPKGNFNDPERVLKFHTPDQLETYDLLTRTDMVLDRWFCTIPGGTYPNRMCYYTGVTPHMNNADVFADAGYFTEITVFDLLDRFGIEWRVFESDISFLRMFARYRLDETRIRPFSELAELNQLPPVTFIDPNFFGVPSGQEANDDHPPAKISVGQEFIAGVIRRLQDLADWPRTMLVITYDEHGGFADHVPPPGAPHSDFPPNADGTPSVPVGHPEAATYGVRVPTFVVAETATAGGVGHRVYDHATVMRTIIERFMPGVRDSVVLPERVRRARHLGEVIEGGPIASAPRPRFTDAVLTEGTVFDGVATATTSPVLDHLISGGAVLQPDGPSIVIHDSDPIRPRGNRGRDPEDFSTLLLQLGNPL